MNFEGLVEPFTKYLGYMLLFWTGDDAIILRYANQDSISPEAFLLAIVGVSSYLVIRYTKLNIIPPDPDPDSGPGPRIEASSIVLIILTSLATPILLEVAFYFLGMRNKYSMASFHGTFNAGFLSIAAYYPLTGLLTRMSAFSVAFSKVGGRPAALAGVIGLLVSFLSIVLSIWACRPFLVVHNLSLSQAWPSILLALVIFLVPASVFAYFLLHWNKYVQSTKNR